MDSKVKQGRRRFPAILRSGQGPRRFCDGKWKLLVVYRQLKRNTGKPGRSKLRAILIDP